jgi:prepilin-type N-terminal cleavage/methylation domain-containing protein
MSNNHIQNGAKYSKHIVSQLVSTGRRLGFCLKWVMVAVLGFLALVPYLSSQSKTESESPTLGDKTFVELTELRQALEKEIQVLQIEVDGLSAKLQERESLEREKSYLEKTYATLSPDTPSALKKAIKRQADEAKARLEIAQTTQAKNDLLRDLNEKKIVLDEKKHQKNKIEQRISELIDIEKPRQQFKTTMSIIFAALVGLVIVGFFITAWKDEKVRTAIFSGQSGIQFVTLFSLVIAIILFGITGILADKELAALLGGLSGYILGRGTRGTPQSSPGNVQKPDQDNKKAPETPQKNKKEAQTPRDSSSAGFSLIELLIVVAIILIIASIAIPNLLKSKMAANESSAVGSGRTVNTAQITYAVAHPKIGFACDLTSLGTAGLIDQVLAGGKKSGYVYAVVNCKRQKGIVVGYTWVASPSVPGTTGYRCFCGDESGVIKYSSIDAADCLRNGRALQ